MLRLKGHREVGNDDEGLRERHVVDERNVRQVDPRLGRGAPVAVDRDIADRLERFIGQRVLLTGRPSTPVGHWPARGLQPWMALELRCVGGPDASPRSSGTFSAAARLNKPRTRRTTSPASLPSLTIRSAASTAFGVKGILATHGRDDDWRGVAHTEDVRAHVDIAHVDEAARPELELEEPLAICPQGNLIVDAGRHVAEMRRRDVLARHCLESKTLIAPGGDPISASVCIDAHRIGSGGLLGATGPPCVAPTSS